jgi:hypothetical protein
LSLQDDLLVELKRNYSSPILTVIRRQKIRIMEPEETAFARERLRKYVFAATDAQAVI